MCDVRGGFVGKCGYQILPPNMVNTSRLCVCVVYACLFHTHAELFTILEEFMTIKSG